VNNSCNRLLSLMVHLMPVALVVTWVGFFPLLTSVGNSSNAAIYFIMSFHYPLPDCSAVLCAVQVEGHLSDQVRLLKDGWKACRIGLCSESLWGGCETGGQ